MSIKLSNIEFWIILIWGQRCSPYNPVHSLWTRPTRTRGWPYLQAHQFWPYSFIIFLYEAVFCRIEGRELDVPPLGLDLARRRVARVD